MSIDDMDVQSRMKATLLALAILSVVTWLPHMYYCLRAFFMESLPSVVSAAVAPKCLFLFSNIIVVFLVSESKLSQRQTSSEPLKAGDGAARDDGMLYDRREEEEEDPVVVTEALLPTITGDSKQEQENIVMVVGEEQGTSVVNEGVQIYQCEEEGDHAVVHEDEVHEVQVKVEEEVEEHESVLGDVVSRDVEQECAAEELEENDLPPADELNRRVEDFIARFNMERQLEARMLVCCY